MFIDHIFEIAVIIIFLVILYRGSCRKPKIKVIKAPTTKQIRRERKRTRRFKKIRRRFRLPYRGKTEIVPYDPKKAYIEAVWDELKKK